MVTDSMTPTSPRDTTYDVIGNAQEMASEGDYPPWVTVGIPITCIVLFSVTLVIIFLKPSKPGDKPLFQGFCLRSSSDADSKLAASMSPWVPTSTAAAVFDIELVETPPGGCYTNAQAPPSECDVTLERYKRPESSVQNAGETSENDNSQVSF